ncbi:MAG: hypothetical protein R3F62_02315 [Planctomycetota bacterium]
MSPRLALLAACLAVGLAAAETLEFEDAAREPLRGRVQVEFPGCLFVLVDGEGPRFVARDALARIVDEGGVAWVDPAPGTFARLLPGAPRGALTDTTLEVRLIQRGHRPVLGGEGPVFVFPGDRAECEGVARLTLVEGGALTLGAGSCVQVDAALTLERGEARLHAGPDGGALRLVDGREVHAAAGSVALVRSGPAAHLYVERGAAAWGLGPRRVLLLAGQGAEALALPGGVRVSADPTNPGPALDLLGHQARALPPAASRGPDGLTRGWALTEVAGQVEVRRGPEAGFAALSVAELHRVRLGPGDAVRVGARGGVALVASGRLVLSPETQLELGPLLSVVQGELGVELPDPRSFAFGPRRGSLAGAGSVRRVGDVYQLEGQGPDGLTWSADAASLSLEAERLLTLRGHEAGWELEGPGLVLAGAGGWSAVLPEFVPLRLAPAPAGVELTCVGQRRWSLAGQVEARLTADGVAALPGGAWVRLAAGGVAAVQSAQVAGVGSAAELTLGNGGRVVLAGAVRIELVGDAVVDGRTQLRVSAEQRLDVRAGQGQAGLALALRAEDRIDLPAGDVRLEREPDAWVLRAGRRSLRVLEGAPPLQARVVSALGDWALEARGLRGLRYPAGAAGRVEVGPDVVRWEP